MLKILLCLSHSVMSNCLRPHGLQPIRFLCPWGFSRQAYWSGLPCPPPEDLPNPGIEPRSPTLQADSLPSEPPGKPMSNEVGSLPLLQGIFPTQILNPGLPHCRQILYHLSHHESPRELEQVACPFSGDLPKPGIEPGSPALMPDSLPAELPGKPMTQDRKGQAVQRSLILCCGD